MNDTPTTMNGSYLSVSMLVGPDARVDCWVYPDRPPILSLVSGGDAGAVTLSALTLDETHVAFAQGLRAAVDRYVTACQLALGTDSHADGDGGPGGPGASAGGAS